MKGAQTPIKLRQRTVANLLTGYVVGAGGCVDGAAVAGFGGREKKKQS